MSANITPRVRAFALVTPVTMSVGWFGAVVAFLALAIGEVTSEDRQRVRAVDLAMHLITWFVIVRFSAAALGTGLVQSPGTPWGYSGTAGASAPSSSLWCKSVVAPWRGHFDSSWNRSIIKPIRSRGY